MELILHSSLALLLIGGIFLSIGDISMKEWMRVSDGNLLIHSPYYLLGLLVYCIGLTFFAYSLRDKNIAVASIIIIFFNVLIVLLVGYFFFNEQFTLLHLIGILLGLASIAVLEQAG